MEAGEGVFSPKDRCYIYRHGMEYPIRIKGVGGGGVFYLNGGIWGIYFYFSCILTFFTIKGKHDVEGCGCGESLSFKRWHV